MFLFDLLFGRKKEGGQEPAPAAVAHAAQEPSAPGTRIHYDPELISRLMEDHQALLETYRSIFAALKSGELMTVQVRLERFRASLMDHLLKENVRLYIYLEHLVRNDGVAYELMHGFRHEMDGIGKVVLGFLGKYREISLNPELAPAFSNDLARLGEALVARIKREEEILYPMYQPPD